MFAVIKTGGKQYRVAADDRIVVMTLSGEAGAAVTFGEVLSVSDAGTTAIGTPFVPGATVAGEIVEQKRGPKVIAFKKRRRQNSRRKRGHKQDLTVVRITDIVAAGFPSGIRAPAPAEAATDGVAAHVEPVAAGALPPAEPIDTGAAPHDPPALDHAAVDHAPEAAAEADLV